MVGLLLHQEKESDLPPQLKVGTGNVPDGLVINFKNLTLVGKLTSMVDFSRCLAMNHDVDAPMLLPLVLPKGPYACRGMEELGKGRTSGADTTSLPCHGQR